MRALMVTEKTGPVAAARVVREAEELMIISAGGLVIRTPVATISRLGRSAQGVNVMNLNENDRVASISFASGSMKRAEEELDVDNGSNGGKLATADTEVVQESELAGDLNDGRDGEAPAE